MIPNPIYDGCKAGLQNIIYGYFKSCTSVFWVVVRGLVSFAMAKSEREIWVLEPVDRFTEPKGTALGVNGKFMQSPGRNCGS